METGRPCFFKRTEKQGEKGCQREAKHRVILGDGYFLDVCDFHVGRYQFVGLKIIPLEKGVKVELRQE